MLKRYRTPRRPVSGRVLPPALLAAAGLVLLLISAVHDPGVTAPREDETAGSGTGGDPGFVYKVVLADAIGPVTARFVGKSILASEEDGAMAAVIVLDTPGGLDTSMREMVKAILGADVPVIVYVAPPGARAASAGLFVTLAAPVAAMAPGTSIGAATPVPIGTGAAPADTTEPSGAMTAKATHDASAYARSLASRHGRNAAWAERAVREAVSLSAEEAVRDTVVDLIASTLEELLELVDGREVSLATGTAVLRTAGAEVRLLTMSWRERMLALITNPSIAYLLFLAGILGIGLELYNPGTILPGVVGAISLILAFFAFQSLPVTVAGVLLIILAVVMFALEFQVTSYGLLSIGGIVSLILGSLLLFERGSAARVSLSVLIPAVATFAAFFIFAVYMALRAQRRPRWSGADGMRGEIGKAATDLDPEGQVLVHGEYWNARAAGPIPAGKMVRVTRVDGLRIEVEPAESGQETNPGR